MNLVGDSIGEGTCESEGEGGVRASGDGAALFRHVHTIAFTDYCDRDRLTSMGTLEAGIALECQLKGGGSGDVVAVHRRASTASAAIACWRRLRLNYRHPRYPTLPVWCPTVTLIVAVTSPESIWMVGDRRISFPSGPPKDDGYKIMALETTDGVALLGYAGLGLTGRGTQPAD